MARTPPFRSAVAVSEHPLPVESTGEVVGRLLDAGLAGAELVVVAVAPGLAGALEDIAASLARLLGARHCLGLCAAAVLGGGRLLDDAGLVALAVAGAPWRAARPEEATPPWAAGVLVGARGGPGPLDGRIGGTPGSRIRPIGTSVGAVHLDGEPAPAGVVLWCEAPGAAHVVDLGGWRALGPARVAGADRHHVTTLDGRPAAEVVVGELAALEAAQRQGVLDVALRPYGTAGAGGAVALGAEPPTGSLRTSAPIPDGSEVQVVVRAAGALVAELEEVLGGPGGGSAMVCSALLGAAPAAAGSPRSSSPLATALASASSEHPLIGVALDTTTLPPPVVAVLVGA